MELGNDSFKRPASPNFLHGKPKNVEISEKANEILPRYFRCQMVKSHDRHCGLGFRPGLGVGIGLKVRNGMPSRYSVARDIIMSGIE